MSSRYQGIRREGKALKKAQSYSSTPSAPGKALEKHVLNNQALRKEMTDGHATAQKRRADDNANHEREKLRRLEVPSYSQEFDVEAPVFNLSDVLSGC
ncbi:hypothetical protein Agabi119p4_10565 [Agaricus bisporus var. burnettii]|uniref:Uncharacterized protein n=1 Tax=Agaricus bisporus var. burnettii TaxID=192524 RepID=A0A8H7EWJ4_AGABI|nr:hypothetical protein Agabi119p4_10565 [Agaricus bisporus var. burnettii]